MKLPPYPKYKPSGVEWIGEVPEHWQAANLRRFALMRTGHTPSRTEPSYWDDGEIPWFTLADVWQLRDGRRVYLGETKERISRSGLANSAAELLPAGTVVFSRTASIGFSGIMPVPMATTQDFWNWIPGPRLDPEYLLFLFRSMRQEFQKLTMGSTHKTIYQPDAARLAICVPSKSEQAAIVRYLNRQTATIDMLIAKKRTLIERLKEKRTALISHTVTRGLPPDVARDAGFEPHPELKPSGVDWLGDIPAHWESANLRNYALLRTGHTPSRREPSYWDNCEIPWFTLADVWQIRDGKRIYLGDTEEQISDLGLANSAAKLLPAGTVVLSRTASVGFSGIMPRPMATSQDFWNWIPGPRLLPEYLLFVFRSMSQHFQRLTMGSTHKTIYQPDAAGIKVCVPPQKEQQVIVAYLIRETEKVDRLIDKMESTLARLLEYRSALITATVTGKVDVRAALAVEPALR
jgi:type I restriction enzyme S subunit